MLNQIVDHFVNIQIFMKEQMDISDILPGNLDRNLVLIGTCRNLVSQAFQIALILYTLQIFPPFQSMYITSFFESEFFNNNNFIILGRSLSSTTYDDINSREYYGKRVFPCKVVTDLKFPAHHWFDCKQREKFQTCISGV